MRLKIHCNDMHRNTYRHIQTKAQPGYTQAQTTNSMLCMYVFKWIIAVVVTNTGIPDTLVVLGFVVLLGETISST